MAITSNNNKNGNVNGGYTKLEVGNFVENGSAFTSCCYRKCKPWQCKVGRFIECGKSLTRSRQITAVTHGHIRVRKNENDWRLCGTCARMQSSTCFLPLLLLFLSGVVIWLVYNGMPNGTSLSFVAKQHTVTGAKRLANSGVGTAVYGHNNSMIMHGIGKGGGPKKGAGRGGGSKRLITECKLPRVDPWDPVIVPWLDPSYYINWQRDCKRTYPELTQLVNGQVVLHPEAKNNGTHCQFKCLYPNTDIDFTEGAWKEVDEQPDCDVIETQCQHKSIQNNAFYYNYLHVQVYRKPESKKNRDKMPEATTAKPTEETVVDIERTPDFASDKHRPPDVHVIVIDSVSHTAFLRTMTKTVTYLWERMGAVSFPHLNKVGHNSRPNAYGIFFGIQSYPVEPSPMGEGYKPPRDLDAMGSVYLDNEPFVGFEFRDKGYRTMMAEDWGKGVLNWPGQKGFERTPVDHYMRPFQLRTEHGYDPEKKMHSPLYENSCKEYHHHIMSYLMDFIDAYEEESKFSISWMSEIGHDDGNGLYRLDDEVYRFLRDYDRKKKLSNSFLFIMGDHGMRFGPIRWTKPGEVEDNNPALFMVLPEHLRYNNRLADNLRENARQLITHFDVHATLVNIARQGQSMSVDTPFDVLAPELKGPTPLGQSLLYPLDKNMPRNCATLKIPFDFCQCQFQTKNITETDQTLGMAMAEKMAMKMNADIVLKKADDKCAHLTLKPDQQVELIEFEQEQHIDVFKVTFETVPGDGRFWGYMQVQERGLPTQEFTYISQRFPRLNEYGKQAYCNAENYAIAPYCYCKELLNKISNATEAPTTTAKPQQQQQNLVNGENNDEDDTDQIWVG